MTDYSRTHHSSSQLTKSWEKIQKKLHDRDTALTSLHSLSKRYRDSLQPAMAWLPDAITTFDALPVVTSTPEAIAKQRAQLQELEEGVADRERELTGARDLCAQLCDVTSETSTRFDLKSKLSSVERPLSDLRKQLGVFSIVIYSDMVSV